MGDHLCLALRFLCDGMIYFSWGLINGFSSKVAFAINNETPRKQFFCFDVGLHVILYCPSFSDWNKVCVDRCCTFAKMNHSAFFFFCPSVLDNTITFVQESSPYCFTFQLKMLANWN